VGFFIFSDITIFSYDIYVSKLKNVHYQEAKNYFSP